MLNDADASGFKKVYLAMGFTDLRRGIDGLATIVRFQFKLDPYDKNTLFLFCGRRCDRIKALLWEGDGFLLMYKRLDNGAFRWTGVPYQMIRKNPVFMRVYGLSEQKSGNEKVEIHGPGSFFIDDTIHDGAEQKSFFLGWFFWIFQNIIDVFYLFPEIFF